MKYDVVDGQIKLYVKVVELDFAALEGLLSTYQLVGQNPPLRLFAIRVPEADAARVLAELNASELVEKAFRAPLMQLDYHSLPATTDTLITDQHALAQMKIFQAHALQRGNTNYKMGVLDEGLEHTHEEYANRSEITGYASWQTLSGKHGTNVASCIAPARNNAAGVYPVAEVGLVNANAFFNDMLECFSGVVAMGAKGISGSFSTSFAAYGIQIPDTEDGQELQEWYDAFHPLLASLHDDIIMCFSAGNTRRPFNYSPLIDVTKSLKVMACDQHGRLADFSSYGSWAHIAAPGVQNIVTTLNNGYEQVSGTSFATPHVAGVCSLVACENPLLSPAEIVSIVKDTSEGSATNQFYAAVSIDGISAVTLETVQSGPQTLQVSTDSYSHTVGIINALKAVLKARSTRRKYRETIVPCINIASNAPTITVSAGEIRTAVPDDFFIEVVGYGDNYNETGQLSLYHGASLIYQGATKEVSKAKIRATDLAETIFKNAVDFTNVTGGVLDYDYKAIGDASVRLYGPDLTPLWDGNPETVEGETSIEFTVDASAYNALVFRFQGEVVTQTSGTPFTWGNKDLTVYVGGVQVFSYIDGMLSANAGVVFRMVHIPLDDYTGQQTVRLAFRCDINDPDYSDFTAQFFRFDEIALLNLSGRYDNRIDIVTITDDLFLVAECNGIKSGYLLPYGGSPVLKCSGIEQTEEAITIDAWDGATTSYKWDDAEEYSTYTEPLAPAGTTLSFFSADAAFSENPMTYEVQSDFTAPSVIATPAAGTHDEETLITLYEPTPDVSQPVVIYYRWDLGAWHTYTDPLPIQDGVLWWYAVDSWDNTSETQYAVYNVPKTFDLFNNPITITDLTGNTITLTPLGQ